MTDASGVTQVGTTTANNLGTADTTKNLKIVPYLVGHVTGGASTGNTFVTYDSTLGFRALDTTNEFSTYASAGTGDNVKVSSAVSGAATKTINSLLISAAGANLTGTAGATLAINSGAILLSQSAAGNAATISGFDSITLGDGTWNEGVITVGSSEAGASNTGGLLTISSSIAGASTGLTKAGKGTLALTAANTFTGITLVNSGTLSIGHNQALQNSAIDTSGFGTVALTVTAPTIGGLTGTTNLASVITSGYDSVTGLTLNPGAGGTNSYSGVIANGAANMTLTKTGSGTQVLSGSNSYTGATMITGGTLEIADGSIASSSGITNNGSLVYNLNANARTYGNVISGSGSLTKSGTNKLTLSGSNSYTGSTTINGGTLEIADGSIAGSSGITNNGSLVYNLNANARTYGNAISGNGSLTKSGTNKLTLSGSNSYTGVTTINGGTLEIADGSIASSSGITNSGLLVYNLNANARTYGNEISGNGSLTKSGTNKLTLSASNSYTGVTIIDGGTLEIADGSIASSSGITNNGALVYNLNANARAYGNEISGNGGLTKSGTNKLTLSGSNSYAGVTTVDGGTLEIADGSIASSSGITNNGALMYNLNANARAYGNEISGNGSLTKSGTNKLTLSGNNSYTGATTINGGTLEIADGSIASSSGITNNGALVYNLNANARAYGNEISGNGSLTKSGTNKLTLSGNNSYTGATTINGGTLEIADGSIANSSGITNNGSLIYNLNANAQSYGNVISGSGSLTKTGSNALTLSGSNTYTGATTVNGGKLVVNGSLAGTVSVASGATLGGSGTAGALTVSSGGTIAPGNSPGNLTVSSATFFNGITLSLELNKSVKEAGQLGLNWDGLTIAGVLDVSNVTTGGITLTLSPYAITGWAWDPLSDHTWSSFMSFGSVTGTLDPSLFTINASAFEGAGQWSIVQNSNSLDLAYLAVPEPSAGVMLLSGFGMFLLMKRRRGKM